MFSLNFCASGTGASAQWFMLIQSGGLYEIDTFHTLVTLGCIAPAVFAEQMLVNNDFGPDLRAGARRGRASRLFPVPMNGLVHPM